MSALAAAGPRVMSAADQREVREALRLLLKGQGYEAEGASSPAEIIEAVTGRSFDVVLMGLNFTRGTISGGGGPWVVGPLPGLAGTPRGGWHTVRARAALRGVV